MSTISSTAAIYHRALLRELRYVHSRLHHSLILYFLSLLLWLGKGRRVCPIPGQDSNSNVAAILFALSESPRKALFFSLNPKV